MEVMVLEEQRQQALVEQQQLVVPQRPVVP
jgi:hypothetical protein